MSAIWSPALTSMAAGEQCRDHHIKRPMQFVFPTGSGLLSAEGVDAMGLDQAADHDQCSGEEDVTLDQIKERLRLFVTQLDGAPSEPAMSPCPDTALHAVGDQGNSDAARQRSSEVLQMHGTQAAVYAAGKT